MPKRPTTPVERMVVEIEPMTLIRLAGAFVALVLVTTIVGSAQRTVTALAIAGILSIALDPVVTRMSSALKVRRGVAVGLLAIGAAIAASLAAALIAPPTIKQANNLSKDVPQVVESMTKLPVVGQRLDDAGVPEKARKWIEDLPDRLSGDTTPLRNAAGTAFQGATALFLVLLFTAGMLIDGPFLIDHVQDLIPYSSRSAVNSSTRNSAVAP